MDLQPPMTARSAVLPIRFVGLGLCLLFTFFFFWPHPPASLLLLVLAAVLTYLRPQIAIALLPLTFPYFLFLQPLSPSGSPAFYISELALYICLATVLLRHIILSDERRATWAWLGHLWQQAGPFLIPALLLVVGALLASLVAPVPRDSLRSVREMIIEPLLYFLLVLRYLRTPSDVARTIGALILSMLVLACIGIGQGIPRLKSFGNIFTPDLIRVDSFTYSANNLAFLLNCAIPLLLALAFLGIWRRPTDSSLSPKPVWREPLRWLCLALMVPMLVALYWTDSRGAEVSLLIVALGFLFFEARSRLLALAVGGVGILGAILFWPKILAMVDEPGHGNISTRLYIWKAALLMIRDHFLLGSGLGSFNILFRASYRAEAIAGQTTGIPTPAEPHPHNFIFDFWISTGLLGVVAIFWLLGAFAVMLRRTYRSCTGLRQASLLRRLLLGMGGCVLASALGGLVDSYYFLPDLAMLFWFFMGILLVLRTIIREEVAALPAETQPARVTRVKEPQIG
ncbi:MAG TPA: O-antigen ligase family protein [Ktedonobacterales bacterium]|nr:O-antigen ligase family protein [Ktedonobacterales bacterium]